MMVTTARASRVIPASAAKVWETLTSKAGMKAYMMGADVETDWRVGSTIVMRGAYGGKPFEDTGEVRAFEPEHRLAYTHLSGGDPAKSHLVTFELTPRGDRTEVNVTQEGGADAQREDYERTWAQMLGKLEAASVG